MRPSAGLAKNGFSELCSRMETKARDFIVLTRTLTPAKAYYAALKTQIAIKKYKTEMDEFHYYAKTSLHITKDWFSTNIPHWLMALDGRGYENREIQVLEIGSWEGLSAHFIMRKFPKASLTCVDTWHGSAEHEATSVKATESNFDFNLSSFSDRLTKYKGTSLAFFADSKNSAAQYDLIYVDGSHYCDDVLTDALEGFRRLKPGGLMIFDDYVWRFYRRFRDNPAAAVNAFLRLKSDQLKVLRVYHQIIIEKRAGL
jgi:predicted O-methyltransferase YrrM